MARQQLDGTTEEKIKEAARKLFVKNGFAATKTRDIAQEAGINLALLNYYFRSKEKLFELIMLENMSQFIGGVSEVLNDAETNLEGKVEGIVALYIDMLLIRPDMPLFILTEIRNDPNRLLGLMESKVNLQKTVLMVQLQEAIQAGRLMPVHPLHFLANVIGLTVFPFIGRPLLQRIGQMNEAEFEAFVKERRKLVPKWMMTMFAPQ